MFPAQVSLVLNDHKNFIFWQPLFPIARVLPFNPRRQNTLQPPRGFFYGDESPSKFSFNRKRDCPLGEDECDCAMSADCF